MRGWLVPAEIFEPFIQAYFDVTADHLRTAIRTYVPEEKVYTVDGVGSAVGVIITATRQNGDELIIEYDVVSGIDILAAKGRLRIQRSDDTHKYLSNEIEWFD